MPGKRPERRWFARLEWKPQDLWLGVFWKNKAPRSLDVWVCVLPMVPVHFGWQAALPCGGCDPCRTSAGAALGGE
jgi:hypothetical protein